MSHTAGGPAATESSRPDEHIDACCDSISMETLNLRRAETARRTQRLPPSSDRTAEGDRAAGQPAAPAPPPCCP